MVNKKTIESKEKGKVALFSVLGAIILTFTKLIVGLLTGSLGILSEALHSGLDLVAAIVTLFAVKVADRPPDLDHPYGHGKVENLSALIETLLLLVTCIWIVYEAIERLITGKTEIEVTFWSFGVIMLSIIIDISRSRALKNVAKKYNSIALEADALHFSTDIFSSLVVIVGLFCSLFNYYIADSIAALLVAIIVIFVSIRLGKRSIDGLLDKYAEQISEMIKNMAGEVPEIIKIHDIKTRTSGSNYLVELNIHVDPKLTIDEAHNISHRLEEKIRERNNRCFVHVHIEPDYEE